MPERKTLLRTAGSISLATLVCRVLGTRARPGTVLLLRRRRSSPTPSWRRFASPTCCGTSSPRARSPPPSFPPSPPSAERSGTEAAWRLANRVVSALVVILGVGTVLLALFAPQIVPFYAPGFGPEKARPRRDDDAHPLAVPALRGAGGRGHGHPQHVRPLLPSRAGARGLQRGGHRGRDRALSLLPRFGLSPVLSLAIGAMAGGLLQFLVQVPALGREGFRFRFDLARSAIPGCAASPGSCSRPSSDWPRRRSTSWWTRSSPR